MSFSSWKLKVVEWRKKYGIPAPAKGNGDPVRIRILAARCAKCGTTKKVHRHHKGHEFLFACLYEEGYAARYIEFRAEDTVPLCKTHHRYIHRRYERTIEEMQVRADLTHTILEFYRLRLIVICDAYLAKPYKGKLHGPPSIRKQSPDHTYPRSR